VSELKDEPVNRLERRKQRTRAALVQAAQALIAPQVQRAGARDHQAADVGMGSFYNHFDSKEQLFEAAVGDVLDNHGAFARQAHRVDRGSRRDIRLQFPADGPAVSAPSAGESDPACQRTSTSWSRAGSGPARVARHHGWRGGRTITVDDPKLAMAVAAGALLGLGKLLQDEPKRDDAAAPIESPKTYCRLFGLPADEAHEICRRPLPDIGAVALPDSA